MLAHIGPDPGILRALRRLHNDNVHYVRVKGSTYPSFKATGGVRQGRPLSLLLFAVVADVLLRRLSLKLLGRVVRAFADDAAMASYDFFKDAGAIMKIFQDFAAFSNLKFNMSKTVLMPLWESSEDEVKSLLRRLAPVWRDVLVERSSCYLGLYIGPIKGSKLSLIHI